MVWFIVLGTALALVNFKLKIPKDISPVKVPPDNGIELSRVVVSVELVT